MSYDIDEKHPRGQRKSKKDKKAKRRYGGKYKTGGRERSKVINDKKK